MATKLHAIYYTPNGSRKGPVKQGLSILPSFRLFFCPGVFLELHHQFFSKFWHGARNPYEVVHDRARFSKMFFCPQNWENGPKRAKTGFFEFIKNFCHQVLLNQFYNKNICYLLCSFTNPIFGKFLVPEICTKMFSANHIVGFFNQSYLQNKSLKQSDFLDVDIHSHKLKVDEKCLGEHSQKCAWPVWSQDSKIDCISRVNRWNELIFLHADENSGKLKVISLILR